MAPTEQQAKELASALGVSLDSGVCLACLSFVAFALDHAMTASSRGS
jgi:hypothetical protein